MSRIGKVPIDLPDKVEVTVDEGKSVKVKGPLGELSQEIKPCVKVDLEDKQIIVSVTGDTKQERAFHGLYRNLIKNMVEGVSKGYQKDLEIVGVGYRADMEGKTLVMKIGFCHPVKITPPDGVTIETPKPTQIVVKGADKQKVGQVAADIRIVRKPEPYKGKGIRYAGENVRRLAGKSFSSGG